MGLVYRLNREGRDHLVELGISSRGLELIWALINFDESAEIAGYLGICISSMKYRKTLIFSRLGVRTSHALVRYLIPYIEVEREMPANDVLPEIPSLPTGRMTTADDDL